MLCQIEDEPKGVSIDTIEHHDLPLGGTQTTHHTYCKTTQTSLQHHAAQAQAMRET